jgi:hypothetical protein
MKKLVGYVGSCSHVPRLWIRKDNLGELPTSPIMLRKEIKECGFCEDCDAQIHRIEVKRR